MVHWVDIKAGGRSNNRQAIRPTTLNLIISITSKKYLLFSFRKPKLKYSIAHLTAPVLNVKF
jgi:hypothetical protein